jgi:hypothetical protein
MLANVKHIITKRLDELESKLLGVSASDSAPDPTIVTTKKELMIGEFAKTDNNKENEHDSHQTDSNKNNINAEDEQSTYSKDDFGMANINGNEEIFASQASNSMMLEPALYHAAKRPDSPDSSEHPILPLLDAQAAHPVLGATVDTEINTAYAEHYATSYEYNSRGAAFAPYQTNENNNHFIDQGLYFEHSTQNTATNSSTSLLKHQTSAHNSSTAELLFHDFSNSQLPL